MAHSKLSTPLSIFSWVCQIAAAIILFQTLFFKFTGAAESVYIFEQVGIEPYGRYASGVAELIAGALLLIPRLSWAGAALAISVMLGAIASHLTVLGIVVLDDGGFLFTFAVIVTICSAIVLWLRRGVVLSLVSQIRK
ncbi:MAG: DoxX family protein [Lentimonas sp.]